MFAYDLHEADVVTLFLLDRTNQRLRSHLQSLRPGTRIVSHRYGLERWTPAKADEEHQLFLYRVSEETIGHEGGGSRENGLKQQLGG
jgi:hypothetical protein